MKSGPKPQPTAKKKLHGNPGRRPLPKNEPKPTISAGVPRPPKSLDKIARKEWIKKAKRLHPAGLLTEIDLTALEAYCVTYATWVAAREHLAEHGMVMRAASGYPLQSPYLAIANKAMVEMRKWIVEFGMTPSSRSRVEAVPVKKENPLKDFMDEGKKLQAVK
jgi:P27 family predicted phage terminase small subunit